MVLFWVVEAVTFWLNVDISEGLTDSVLRPDDHTHWFYNLRFYRG
jgi:hypothetical protein